MKVAKKQTSLLRCHDVFFKKTQGIHISIETRGLKRALPFSFAAIRFVIEKILRKEHIHSAHLTFVLSSNVFIRSLNRKFLSRNEFTDCLAFDLKPKMWPKACLFGDIVISAETAKAVSAAGIFSYREELLRYIVHGILHLTGFDDITPGKRNKMWKRQEQLVSQFLRFLK